MGRDLFAQPLGERDGGVQHGTGQDQQKLLAAVPSDAVDLTRLVLEQPGKLLKDRIARLVTVVVVDALEFVDVAHHDRYRLLKAKRKLPPLLEPLFPRAAGV